MERKYAVALVVGMGVMLGAAMVTGNSAVASGAEFAGPGPGITGNDTGGIFPWSPFVEGYYEQIAQSHCSRWARLAKVTSVHRIYGDYVSFVCYDRPGRIH
jgi:hypothetical protein